MAADPESIQTLRSLAKRAQYKLLMRICDKNQRVTLALLYGLVGLKKRTHLDVAAKLGIPIEQVVEFQKSALKAVSNDLLAPAAA